MEIPVRENYLIMFTFVAAAYKRISFVISFILTVNLATGSYIFVSRVFGRKIPVSYCF